MCFLHDTWHQSPHLFQLLLMMHHMTALRGNLPTYISSWWASAALLIDSGEKVCHPSNPENTLQFCSLQTCDLPKTGQKPHHYKFLRCQSGKALLLASYDEPHLINICAMGAIAHHALRTWPTSDTINSVHTGHSRVAGIGITAWFSIWDIYVHAYNNNNKKKEYDFTLHFEFEGKHKTIWKK